MELLARARIVMWEGAGLWIVDPTPAGARKAQRTDFHAHHAIQLTIGLGNRLRLATATTEIHAEAALVAADALHDFEPGGPTAFVFIAPESRPGRAIAQRFLGGADLVALASEHLGEIENRLNVHHPSNPRDDTGLIALGRELVETLAAEVRGDVPDLRVRRMIAWAAGHIDGPVSLADAGAIGGLSASRLRHLFVAQTGLPFKTYLLWLRLTRAVERLAAGASITAAAHDAGFADSAHLSRTFRRMFGIAPASLHIR